MAQTNPFVKPVRIILGYRNDGRPIYQIAGGAPEAGEEPSGQPAGDQQVLNARQTAELLAGDDDESDDPEADLGDTEAGTLAYWKKRSRKNEVAVRRHLNELNSLRSESNTLRSEFEAFRAKAEGKEQEYTAAQEAQRIKDEAIANANQRILKAEVRAAAAGKLADPQDALRFLDLSKFDVSQDGAVDLDAVSAAIDDLIKSKPYLSAQGKRFQGDADGGARKDSLPAQLKRSDLERMTPEQIVEAKKEGRLADLLSGRS